MGTMITPEIAVMGSSRSPVAMADNPRPASSHCVMPYKTT